MISRDAINRQRDALNESILATDAYLARQINKAYSNLPDPVDDETPEEYLSRIMEALTPALSKLNRLMADRLYLQYLHADAAGAVSANEKMAAT